ncbi:uncharacterized protein LOC125178834 [Hyalella azteca]|uniref:Uncharacterized protein LOC125178834 n=1 Tax=Hyalella azteca TaxID=294128 RepID=A0A979FQV6_HYAAZ|nr:uncharacterized protein LOC125178834 [Hyalella azteca]
MQEYYYELVETMKRKIHSFITITDADVANPSEARSFKKRLNDGHMRTSNLIHEVKNVPADQLAKKISNSVTALGIDGCAEAIQSISKQGEYFAFLRVVSHNLLGTRTWGHLLQPVETYLLDFKDDIQQDINDVTGKIIEQMQTNISNIAAKIKEYYQSKMRSMIFQLLQAEINFGHAFIMNMTKKMKRSNTTQDLSRKLREGVSDDDTFKISSDANNVWRHGKYLIFLQIISNETLYTPSPSQLITPLNEAATYLKESQGWYEFLTNLYEKLSTYNVQKNRIKYNVANIADWGQNNKQQGISITRHNFKQFMENMRTFNVMGYNKIKNIEADDIRVEDLRQVASLTLNKFHVSCQSNKLTIKGGYIRLSEAIVEIGNCKRNTTEIFALNKIFIDKNLNKIGEKLKLVMIAPTWEVIGRRTINLSGADAPPHNPPKASDGEGDGGRGADGRPGLPGGPAGSFFGVGTTFLNGNRLNIVANGGHGGLGQDGGNGGPGSDGDSPSSDMKYYNSYDNNYFCDSLCFGSGECHGTSLNDFQLCYLGVTAKGFYCKVYGFVRVPTLFYNDEMFEIDIHGKDGTPGGDGGDGGRNGYGGKSGDVMLITLGNDAGISSFNNNGSDGTMGKGGEGGAGGREGYSIYLECLRQYALFFRAKDKFIELVHRGDRGYAQSGNGGINGANRANIQNPEPSAIISFKAKIINNYKSYARENLDVDVGGRIWKNDIMKFIRELDTNRDIKHM